MHHVHDNSNRQLFKPLTEPTAQARKPTHESANRQILAFSAARANGILKVLPPEHFRDIGHNQSPTKTASRSLLNPKTKSAPLLAAVAAEKMNRGSFASAVSQFSK